MRKTYVGAIGHSFSKQKEIFDLSDQECPSEIQSQLTTGGFEVFATVNENWEQPLQSAIKQSMSSADLSSQDVDAVIVLSESMPTIPAWLEPEQHRPRTFRENLFRLGLEPLGLGHALIFGMWMSACGNSSSALMVANSLVSSGAAKNVLIVAVERVFGSVSRIMPNNAALLSDVVGSAIVSAEPRCNFSLKFAAANSIPELASSSLMENPLARGKQLTAALREFRSDLEMNPNVSAFLNSDARIFTDNLHKHMLEIAARGLGVESERLWAATSYSKGHSFCFDLFVDLLALEEGKIDLEQQEFLFFNLGPWSFGAALFSSDK